VQRRGAHFTEIIFSVKHLLKSFFGDRFNDQIAQTTEKPFQKAPERHSLHISAFPRIALTACILKPAFYLLAASSALRLLQKRCALYTPIEGRQHLSEK
jgi:hypothetical protein